MPIEVECPKCGGLLRLEDRFAGKDVECTECGRPMRVPDVAPAHGAAGSGSATTEPHEVTFEEKMAVEAEKVKRRQEVPYAARHMKGILCAIGIVLLVLLAVNTPWLIRRLHVQGDISLLNSGSKAERQTAAKHLAQVANSTAVHALIKYANDDDRFVRRHCIMALAKVGDPRACEALVDQLSDSDTTIQQAAAWALATCGTEDAVRPLENLLDAQGVPPSVAVSARYALYRLGYPSQFDAILAALMDVDYAARVVASNALIAIGRKDIIPLIQDAMTRCSPQEQELLKETVKKLKER